MVFKNLKPVIQLTLDRTASLLTRLHADIRQPCPTMATFARSNRVVFNVIIGVVAFLFFLSVYHVSYNYDDIMDKVNGKP